MAEHRGPVPPVRSGAHRGQPSVRGGARTPKARLAPAPRRSAGSSSLPGRAAKALAHALAAFASAIVRHPDKSFFPLSLLLIVAGFLSLQGRIDKSDPKLALAPVYPDPDLEFPPPRPAPS